MIKNPRRTKIFRYPEELKVKVLAEVKATGKVAKIAEKHGIHYGTVYDWIKSSKKVNPDSRIQDKIQKSSDKSNGYLRDISTYLRHARTAANESLRRGTIRQYDQAHLLMMLALAELEKNGH